MSTDQKIYLKKGILYSLAGIFIFCCGYLLGALTNSVTATINKPVSVIAPVEDTTTTTMPTTTTPPTTVAPTTTAPTTTEPTTESTTAPTTTQPTTESTAQGNSQGTEERKFNCSFIEMKVGLLESLRDMLGIDIVTTIIDMIISFCITVDGLFA